MSDHGHYLRLPAPEHAKPATFGLLRFVLTVLAIVGAILSLIGAFVDPRQFAFSWFFAFYYFFTISAGAVFWVLLHYVCNGSWDILIRRIWENLAALFIPLFGIFVPLLVFPPLRDALWQWFPLIGSHNHELAIRAGYLNAPFFYIRVLAYFAFFIAVSIWYRHRSVMQDADGSPAWTFKLHIHSYFLMTLWALIETFVGFDWFMGLDWRWSSSLFGAYNFSVCAQASMAAVIVLAAWLQGKGFLVRLNHEHYHLAGKLLFGFSILWAYFAFGQYLLIWYANIPEETIFYNDHNRGCWKYPHLLPYRRQVHVPGHLPARAGHQAQPAPPHRHRALDSLHARRRDVVVHHAVRRRARPRPTSLVPSWLDLVAFITVASIVGLVFLCNTAKAAIFPPRDPAPARMPHRFQLR